MAPAQSHVVKVPVSDERPIFAGLEGVDDFASSPALEILRELGHGPEFGALMRLAEIVEAQEAAMKAAA